MGFHLVWASGPSCGVFLTEVCVPLLLLCWLCWPGSEQDNSETSSNEGRPPKKPILICDSPCLRRSSDSCATRELSPFLPLPTTSGGSGLSSHRSHEEFRSSAGPARRSDSRYHSAPSVIHEVLHRRDWDTTHAHLQHTDEENVYSTSNATELQGPPTCKKHNKNIKSTRNKEHLVPDDKETDSTETHFYIGDTSHDGGDIARDERDISRDTATYLDNDAQLSDIERVLARNKLVKQTINEFRKNKTAQQEKETDDVDSIESVRDGAMHHCFNSSVSLRPCLSRLSQASVEPVGYGYCVLEDPPTPFDIVGGTGVTGVAGVKGVAAVTGVTERHSEGDILHSTGGNIRPQSGAFSESEVEVPPTKKPTINPIKPISAENKLETAV